MEMNNENIFDFEEVKSDLVNRGLVIVGNETTMNNENPRRDDTSTATTRGRQNDYKEEVLDPVEFLG
jgi:hypothetical protein